MTIATLRDRLRAGDVWIEGSRAYRRFDDYLIPQDDVAAQAQSLPVQILPFQIFPSQV